MPKRELKQINVYDIDPTNMSTSDALYNDALRVPEGKYRMGKASLYSREIGNGLMAYLMQKRSLYVSDPSMDHLLYIAREGGYAKSINDIDSKEFAAIMHLGKDIQNCQLGVSNDEVNMQVMSLNFHDDPILSESTFGRKVHAQSLSDLHLHVFSLTDQELIRIEQVDYCQINKRLQDYMVDPITPFITSVLTKPEYFNILLSNTNSFESVNFQDGRIILDTTPTDLDNLEFCRDIQQLVQNYCEIQHELAALFVDKESLDDRGMPIPFDKNIIERNISQYCSERPFLNNSDKRYLTRLGGVLRRSDSIGQVDRVFLRGAAYTLSMITQPHTNEVIVDLSPRVISTGNALSALGYLYKKTQPDATYIEVRNRRDEAIIKQLARMNNDEC